MQTAEHHSRIWIPRLNTEQWVFCSLIYHVVIIDISHCSAFGWSQRANQGEREKYWKWTQKINFIQMGEWVTQSHGMDNSPNMYLTIYSWLNQPGTHMRGVYIIWFCVCVQLKTIKLNFLRVYEATARVKKEKLWKKLKCLKL